MTDIVLSQEQQQVFDLCENSDANLMVIGKPGVGKSVLIRALVETGQKYYVLAAPTGLAAINIGGKTIHSIFGIVPSEGIFTEDYDKYTTNPNTVSFITHRLKTLIIDEISMVRADMLDYIDRALRHIKNSDSPFGGIQVICFGDFYQLPPVVKSSDKKELQEAGYESEYAFDSRIFKLANFSVHQLHQVHRQSDPRFLEVLHSARSGKVTGKHIALLNKQVSAPNDMRIKLTPLNRQANSINQAALKAIKAPSAMFTAKKFGYWPANPIDELVLKPGAQVMIKKNGADRPANHKGPFDSKVVNGTIGTVKELPCDENGGTVVILTDTGYTVKIEISRWERKEKERIDGKWGEKTVATFEQYPLQLAWAISMHKSQGQTFDKVHIDPTSIFTSGQFYVALSRARTLGGISFQTTITQRVFMVNSRVVKWTSNL